MYLMDTIELMNSPSYAERFKAEYWQTKIRYDRLHKMIVKYEAKTLSFTPVCRLSLLYTQQKAMYDYLQCLEIRAELEGINLDGDLESA